MTRVAPLSLATFLAGALALSAPGAGSPPSLTPYLDCGASDSLLIGRTDRAQSGKRRINVGWKTYDIGVEDGYRLLYGYPGNNVPMANVKIERGTKRFAKEKKWIVESHRRYDKFGFRQERWDLHGFDTYASEADTLFGGGVVGHYSAFGDSNRLLISVYLLDQANAETNRFRTIGEFRDIRRGFLERLLACADSVRRLE